MTASLIIVKVYVCTTYWVHLVLLVCTCIRDSIFGIGQPIWELIPGKKIILSLSAVSDYNSSPKDGIFWNFPYPCWHVNWCFPYANLVQEPYFWDSLVDLPSHVSKTFQKTSHIRVPVLWLLQCSLRLRWNNWVADVSLFGTL